MSEIKQALAAQRKELKIRLYRERRCDAYSTFGPPCVYCGEKIRNKDAAVMHEWLIRKAALPVKLQHKIMHEYNCVLLHVECSDQYETTATCKLRCARAQYKRYGRDKIVAWVEGLGLKQTVEIPREEEV